MNRCSTKEHVLAEKTKGIRVNALAKELGVESKAILHKLKEEGLGDVAPNHMSVIKTGLAESVREWFHAGELSGGGGTAVETAAPVEVAIAKPKVVRARKKKAAEAPPEEGEPTSRAPATETELPSAPEPAVESPIAPPPVIEPVVEAPEVVIPSAAPSVPEAPAIAAEAPAPVAPFAPAPAAIAPAAAPPKGGKSVVHDLSKPPQLRATITLADRQGGAPPARKPVTPAPQLVKPKPAIIAGPTIVREEAPEHVPLPRPRRPVGDAPSGPAPGITTARPGGGVGRGVKTTDDDEEKKEKAKAGRSLSARRRGVDGRRGEAMEKLKEFSDADLLERQERLAAAAASRATFDSHLKKTQARGTHAQALPAGKRGEPIYIEEPITVKSLSAATGVKTNDIMKKLMAQGVFASINQTLDGDAAIALAVEFGVDLQIVQEETLEEQLMAELQARPRDEAQLAKRPAVVTILGHVDHGKTSLLDKIRNANVAAGEAGGITQHTAAWVVEIESEDKAKKRVTFIDTPGHQAFTRMRARGANMTDVVVLVVAAVEGVMPQTVESINHARAAGVPIVVALNKIDRPDANPDMVLGQLAQHELNPVEWGGTTEVIRTSATTGQGIKELIEILDYQAELLDLKADPAAPARGMVIESRVDPGLGSVATVLVQDGTLQSATSSCPAPATGRIRSLINDRGERIQEAGPSTPSSSAA
jgi:translation initiation factor IF-2